MKLYAVATGSYSDFQVDEIFSTREKAQEYIDTVVVDRECDIVEYDLDPTDWKGKKVMFAVSIDRTTGNVTVVGRSEPDESWYYGEEKDGCFQYDGYRILMYLKSDSKERVKKVASEMWMQIKALRLAVFPYLYDKVVDDRRHFNLPCHEYPMYNFYTKQIVLTETQHLDIPDPNAPNMMEGVVIL